METMRKLCGAFVTALMMMPLAASAALVEFGYEGVVQGVDPALAAALPPGSPIALGAPVVVNYTFESTTADSDTAPTSGVYSGAITSFTLWVGGQAFDHQPGGPLNEIDVLSEQQFSLYQPVDSVVTSPSLPGYPTLEADIIFISTQGGVPGQSSPLSDDSLPTTAPDPADTAWDSADAAIYDDANTLLIDIGLTTLCAGACPAPAAAPVPVGAAPGLMAALLAAGVAALLRVRRSASRAA